MVVDDLDGLNHRSISLVSHCVLTDAINERVTVRTQFRRPSSNVGGPSIMRYCHPPLSQCPGSLGNGIKKPTSARPLLQQPTSIEYCNSLSMQDALVPLAKQNLS